MRVTVVTAAGDEVVGASLVLVAVATAAGLAAGLSALRTRRGGGDGGGGSNGDDLCAGGGASGESLSLVDDGGEGELVDGDPLDHHTFIAWGTAVLHWIVGYRRRCDTLPVRSTVEPGYLRAMVPLTAPEQGEGWRSIMSDLDRVIVPGLTHWESSARFFAYFKCHSSYPAVLGELLCAGINVMGFDWIASPACTELECVVLEWLGKLLNLPPSMLPYGPGPGGAVIQGSSGEATIVVLLAAAVRAAAAAGGSHSPLRGDSPSPVSGASGARRDVMVVYCSDQTHAIVQKACMVLGIGHLRELPTTAEGNWSLPAEMLAEAIRADRASGLLPIGCVATCGTTTSCAFDDVEAIAAVCHAESVWLHIDAAYGGAYACLPEMAPYFRGVERADSFMVNCHKKMLVPFDLCALYLQDRRPILDALSLQPEYLRNDASADQNAIDFEHWQMPLGRRFRALKLWFVLRSLGAERMREHLRAGIELRKRFEQHVRDDSRLELAAPPSLSLCCFRLAGESDVQQMAFLRRVNATGRCFIIHSKLGGRVLLRFACGGLDQKPEHVDAAWRVIHDAISH